MGQCRVDVGAGAAAEDDVDQESEEGRQGEGGARPDPWVIVQ